ncbi:MAG: hypothetical protein LBE09_05050 [Christensenellaceae bacterium]|jgi:hypothetical protein|nr:hypothetical protein [Christensenellaceae bacterium]
MKKIKLAIVVFLTALLIILPLGCLDVNYEYEQLGKYFFLGGNTMCIERGYLVTNVTSPEAGKKLIKVDVNYTQEQRTIYASQVTLISDDGDTEYSPYMELGDTLGFERPANGLPTVYFLVNENELKFTFKVIVGLTGKLINFTISAYQKEITEPDTSFDSVYFEKKEYSKTVYVVDARKFNRDRLALLINIQGIVAKTKAEIYIDRYNDISYLYTAQCYDPEINIVRVNDLFELLKMFESHVKDKKFVTYNSANGDIGINLASTVSAAESYLAVPESLRSQVEQAGFEFHEDMSLIEGDRAQKQRVIFNRYKDVLNKNLLIHQPVELSDEADTYALRDYGISNSCFIFFTRHDEQTDVDFLRNEVLPWANSNTPILGWSSDELEFVIEISKFGDFIIASDYAFNLSYLSALEHTTFSQPNEDRQITGEQGKHYVALLLSDGDNLQYFQGEYLLDGSLFAQRLKGRTDYKLTWTVPPLAFELNAYSLQRVYASASENDHFITGPSGAGYMNSSLFPNDILSAFVEKTTKAMRASDIDVITLLDNKHKFANGETSILEKAGYYSSQDAIKGGIWLMDPSKYEYDKGKIYWSNDKPFITVRRSLWDTNPSELIIRSVANVVNMQSTDITTNGAYSLINVHVWTITQMSWINYFVDNLASHVEVVSVGELIDIASANVVR